MKTIVLSLCVVCLLIPFTSAAEQPDFTPLISMLTAGTLDVDELRSIMSEMLNADGLTGLPADEITTEANYLTYVCYYIGFTAIFDFIDCLVYYDINYNCRSAIINALLFYYFCR